MLPVLPFVYSTQLAASELVPRPGRAEREGDRTRETVLLEVGTDLILPAGRDRDLSLADALASAGALGDVDALRV